MQAHSFYETLQKSKVSVEDIKENTEVRAGNEKGVLMIIRDRAEHIPLQTMTKIIALTIWRKCNSNF